MIQPTFTFITPVSRLTLHEDLFDPDTWWSDEEIATFHDDMLDSDHETWWVESQPVGGFTYTEETQLG